MDVENEITLRVLTESSIWFVRQSTYLRLPRDGVPRAPLEDLDGATRDGGWHQHSGVWLVILSGVLKLNILPAGRPDGSIGLLSGPVDQIAIEDDRNSDNLIWWQR